MTKEDALKYLQQLYPNGGHCWLDEQRIEAIGMAVKALQEEPVSEDLEEAAIKYADENTEDPTEMDEYDSEYFDWHDYCERVYKAGAQWQREQMIKNAIDTEVTDNICGFPCIRVDIPHDFRRRDKVKVIIVKED